MRAYRLTSGEILHPQRAEGPGLVGDGWALAEAGSPEAAAWEPFAEPLPARMRPLADRLLAQRDVRRHFAPR